MSSRILCRVHQYVSVLRFNGCSHSSIKLGPVDIILMLENPAVLFIVLSLDQFLLVIETFKLGGLLGFQLLQSGIVLYLIWITNLNGLTCLGVSLFLCSSMCSISWVSD